MLISMKFTKLHAGVRYNWYCTVSNRCTNCMCYLIAAGVCGLVVGHPMDTIKVRQQTLGGVSAWRCAVTTVKYEGVSRSPQVEI